MDLPFSVPPTEFLDGPGGLKIHYRRCGSPDRPALLLTPGAAQSLLCWRRQMEALSQQFQVIAWETPGHGATLPSSVPPDQLSAETFTDAMEALVEGLHLREVGYIAVGWSFGGWMTGNFVLKYGTEGLRGIVIVGSTFNIADTIPLAAGDPRFASTFETILSLSSQDVAVRDQALLAFARWLTEQKLPEEEFYLTLGYTAWSALNGYLRMEKLMEQLPGDATVLFREHNVPVLFIMGEHDMLASPLAAQADAAKLGVDVHIYEGGHSPFLEYSDRFNEDVLAFAQRAFALSEAHAS